MNGALRTKGEWRGVERDRDGAAGNGPRGGRPRRHLHGSFDAAGGGVWGAGGRVDLCHRASRGRICGV